jgi:transketolase
VGVKAQELLAIDGIAANVVSMPCWELFDAQPAVYRASVLGDNTVKVAIEAAVSFGWEKYIGADGAFIGMSGFGASAPAGDLFKHFGITAEAVAAAAKKRLPET